MHKNYARFSINVIITFISRYFHRQFVIRNLNSAHLYSQLHQLRFVYAVANVNNNKATNLHKNDCFHMT